MSLKSFHWFFLFVSTLLMVGLEGWALKRAIFSGESIDLVLVGTASLGILLLVAYAAWFFRKYKNLSWW